MTRRDFFVRTAGGAALLASTAASAAGRAAAPLAAIPAIDTHVHFYDPTRPQGVPWPPKSDALLHRPCLPDDLRALAAADAVVGVIAIEASDWLEDNTWLLDLARDQPLIVGVVGNLAPGQPEFGAQLRRFSANPLFRGLRLNATALVRAREEAVFAADLRRVAEAELALDVLGGPAILPATLWLAKRLPTLRIVVDHLPFAEWDGGVPALRAALAELGAQRNVFIKISGLARRGKDGVAIDDPAFYQPALGALVELFGPDRVLYASNWPVSDRVAPYPTVHRIVAEYFSDQKRALAERFFWRNSLAAYRWQRRGAAAVLAP